ncbi:hypothetical protein P7E02_05255 [Enterococcus hulanensis]|uniref:hypothetical protein n=1 Tax=Enterococcus hulanensis TaxID=2559929 RepID=UPI002891D876|nr:hypothetical protein [Enterococcus hulanensis]MDT2659264.1 hypothetical protein [Enterococcus hulanensis]
MKITRIKTIVTIGLISLFLLGAISPNYTYAKSESTAIMVTFQESTTPQSPISNVKTDLPNSQTIMKKSSGFGEILPNTSVKRLPVTGEEYNQVMIVLGWLSILIALLCFLSGRLKKGEDNASSQN